ncbi:MAG TPA: hypothetical protein VFG93_03255, partial [Gaiellaceae bacterium]|nr:hypothetical protein [Gaiellaceae bacterium]
LTLFCRRPDSKVPGTFVANLDQVTRETDTERYGGLFRHLLEHGIYIAPSQFEAMFPSLAHGDEEIDRTIEAVANFAG